MPIKYPSIDQLRQMFRYEPATGNIYWSESGKGKIKKKAAGTTELNGYRAIMICGKRIRSHKIAWAIYHGEWPKHQIDHVNGVREDNRIKNLRRATNLQNGKNLPVKKNNTSGYPGVSLRGKKWRAQIKVNYKMISLGTYLNFEDAVNARKTAEIKYYGEWRRYK